MKKTQYKWRKIGGKGSQAGYGGPRYGALYVQSGTCVASLMGEDARRAWTFDVTGQANGFRRSGSGHNFEVAQYRAEEALTACKNSAPLRGLACAVGDCGQMGSLFADFTGRVSAGLHKHMRKAKSAGKKAWKKARSRW